MTGCIFVAIVVFMETTKVGRECLALEDEEKALAGVAAGDNKGGDHSREKMRGEGGSSD